MKIVKPRLVIAGTASGTGKTTIVTGLLAALKEKGNKVQSFKIGPDYIDPGFHKLASGRPSHNLDSWLVPEDKLPNVFKQEAQDADIAVVEGVMGLYDGGRNGVSSTANIAKRLGCPVVLVLNCKSVGESIAATLLGFLNYDKDVDIKGVILNNLGSKSHGELVEQAIKKLNIPIVGKVLKNEQIALPERHLGLTPVEEQDLEKILNKIKDTIASSVDLEKIIDIANQAKSLEAEENDLLAKKYPVTIGVAYDEAFSFYYQTSLSVLEDFGAKIVKFSPLHDDKLPKVDGLLFGGGFPEMFAQQLSANVAIRSAIKEAANNGLPIVAECGGFMYLTEQLQDFTGHKHSMVGLIKGSCNMQNRLQTVGYVKAKALKDNILITKDESLKGHEFHFSTFTPNDETDFPWAFDFEKMRTGNKYLGGFAKKNILASYLHMNFLGNISAAERFLMCCYKYKETKS